MANGLIVALGIFGMILGIAGGYAAWTAWGHLMVATGLGQVLGWLLATIVCVLVACYAFFAGLVVGVIGGIED